MGEIVEYSFSLEMEMSYSENCWSFGGEQGKKNWNIHVHVNKMISQHKWGTGFEDAHTGYDGVCMYFTLGETRKIYLNNNNK